LPKTDMLLPFISDVEQDKQAQLMGYMWPSIRC
jgi:hypothetical protein